MSEPTRAIIVPAPPLVPARRPARLALVRLRLALSHWAWIAGERPRIAAVAALLALALVLRAWLLLPGLALAAASIAAGAAENRQGRRPAVAPVLGVIARATMLLAVLLPLAGAAAVVNDEIGGLPGLVIVLAVFAALGLALAMLASWLLPAERVRAAASAGSRRAGAALARGALSLLRGTAALAALWLADGAPGLAAPFASVRPAGARGTLAAAVSASRTVSAAGSALAGLLAAALPGAVPARRSRASMTARTADSAAAILAAVSESAPLSFGPAALSLQAHADEPEVERWVFAPTAAASASSWLASRTAWLAAADAVRFALSDPDIILSASLTDRSFICERRHEAVFPSLPATALLPFIEAHRADYARSRRRWCAGLDAYARPVWLDWADDAPHYLVSGTTGSGKTVSLLSAVAQLCAANTPAALRVWLLDSRKRELSPILGDSPYLEQRAVGSDPEAALDLLRSFAAAMTARYARLNGRSWHTVSADGPVNWLIVEEAKDLFDQADKPQRAELESLLGQIAQVGRAAAFHEWVLIQKPTTSSLPSTIKANLSGRLIHRGDLPDYQVVLGAQKANLVSIPKAAKGRVAVELADGTLAHLQGLFAPTPDIAAFIARCGTGSRDGR